MARIPALTGPIFYCGDSHGSFEHIVEAAVQTNASVRPTHLE